MRFMSLIFGSVLVVIGSAFVLARINVPKTDGELKLQDISVSLRSGSAGLFLVAMGVVLISIPNLAKQSIIVDDTSTYVAKEQVFQLQLPGGTQLDIAPGTDYPKPKMPNYPSAKR